eukprot:CAMPEP_0173369954 /NCGR_PEP_ID=MMETSP1144-20121109/26390_1 /TAXON_ID=483371 /ORGANISM="non described non described, Strain CCMP2298" /LENGTH=164 /DNA_ID=CAMNT_0014321397 /DNA_START=868 /DNA_END=1362 /DNA_ORIENTATION=+
MHASHGASPAWGLGATASLPPTPREAFAGAVDGFGVTKRYKLILTLPSRITASLLPNILVSAVRARVGGFLMSNSLPASAVRARAGGDRVVGKSKSSLKDNGGAIPGGLPLLELDPLAVGLAVILGGEKAPVGFSATIWLSLVVELPTISQKSFSFAKGDRPIL